MVEGKGYDGRENMDLWNSTRLSTDKLVPVLENKESTEKSTPTRLIP
jgi:hypothetical protein